MCKFNPKNDSRRIDPCMKKAIETLNKLGIKTLSCCCGHEKYPMTIIIHVGFSKKLPQELFTGIQFEREKRFYKKDKQGYYFIPEVSNEK